MSENEIGHQEPGEVYRRINVDEAHQLVKEGNSTVIDVRQENEWLEGHVQNALHICVDDLLSKVDSLPDSGNLLFICAAGVRSGLACEMAAAMGIDTSRLYNIEQGTPTWISNNYPTEYGK